MRNVACTFGGRGGIAVRELDIPKGCTTAILGRSGSGKSTLLHLLGGMLAADQPEPGGQISFEFSSANGQAYDLLKTGCWPALRRRIGFVFQDPVLFRDATCRTNLATSLAAAGLPIDQARIEKLWRDLGLKIEKLDQPARALSGGMQQRVAVARALIRDPEVIFADEPTASLDPLTGEGTMRLLQEWQQAEPQRSLILITHDINLAFCWAARFVVLALPAEGSENSSVGRLSNAMTWPARKPRDAAVLRAWMEETIAPARHSEGADDASHLTKLPRFVEKGHRSTGASQ